MRAVMSFPGCSSMSSDLARKQYTRLKRLLSISSFILTAVFLLVLLFGNLSLRLREWVTGYTTNPALVVLGYLVTLTVINELVHLPLSFWSGYRVEHQFQLSNQKLGSWLWDHVKGFVLSLALAIVAAELVYLLLRRYPAQWWWISAAVFVLFVILMAQLAPIVLFLLFYKFEPLEDERLKNRLMALCERWHTRVRGVYNWKISEKSNKANAALVGLGKTRRIILADTLLQDFSEDEIEVILAHEVGHHVHRDMMKNIAVQTVSTFAVFFLIHSMLDRLTRYFGFRSIADVANLPLLMAISTLFSLLALPALNGLSRRAERAADRFALKSTRKVDAFVSSMEKLGEKNLAERQPNPWIEFIFHSHPSIARRVAMAHSWAQASNHRTISNASSPLG